tara:strand:+ start:3465 stop:4070 length:606 start_codon:yes stop_codon:yes gene_type:complete
MWFYILKVDEFVSTGSSGRYDGSKDKVKINLDRFETTDEKYSDDDRIAEFTDVATHEYVHREFNKEMPNYVSDSIDKIQEMIIEWSNSLDSPTVTLQDITTQIMSLATKLITDESFAHMTMQRFVGANDEKNAYPPRRRLYLYISRWFDKLFTTLAGYGEKPFIIWHKGSEKTKRKLLIHFKNIMEEIKLKITKMPVKGER